MALNEKNKPYGSLNRFFHQNPLAVAKASAIAILRNSPLKNALKNILANYFETQGNNQPIILWVEDLAMPQIIIKRSIAQIYQLNHEQEQLLTRFFLDTCQSSERIDILVNLHTLLSICQELGVQPQFSILLDHDLGEAYKINGSPITGDKLLELLKLFDSQHPGMIKIIPNSSNEDAYKDSIPADLLIPNKGKAVQHQQVLALHQDMEIRHSISASA